MLNHLLTGTLAVVLIGAVALEGWTILRALRGWGPDGPARVARIGWLFLLTEGWVLTLLGLGHATTPALAHHLLGAAWGAVMVYGAGWMLRDLGLWRVALAGRAGWTRAVAFGAAVQTIGLVWAVVAMLADADRAPAFGHTHQPVTIALLGLGAPVCVGIVVAVQSWVFWQLRSLRSRPGGLGSVTGCSGCPATRASWSSSTTSRA